MSECGKKWMLWGNLFALIISIGALIYLSIIPYTRIIGNYQTITLIIIILAIINLGVILSIKYQERKWVIRSAKFSLYILPFISLAFYLLFDYIDSAATWIAVFLVCMIVLLILLALIYVFLFREAGEMKGILVLLLFIVISVVLQRFDFSLSATEDLLLPGFVILTAAGLYMYGLRCIMIIEKNSYLKSVSFIACILTAFGSFLFLLKLEGEKIDILELVYIIPALLLTLIVLLSLPVSGYVQWSLLHKRILKKIALTSIFFLLIFSFRFLYPDFFKQLILKPAKEYPEFYLEDYKIPDKNGLEP